MTDIRKEVFLLAKERLKKNNVLLELATGVGKTKIALELAEDFGAKNVVVLVPTDPVGEAWTAEVKKWNSPLSVFPVNYKSAHKVLQYLYPPDMVIMDECHHVTQLNLESIIQYGVPMVGLSATVDWEKMALLKQLGFERGIEVSLDKATEHEIIAPYEMHIISFPVDSTTANMLAGNKDKRWYSTEEKHLAYLETRISQAKRSGNKQSIEWAYMTRMRAIRTLPSRSAVASKLLKKLRAKYPNGRILVFAAEIAQCEAIVPECYYHSKSTNEGFDQFVAGQHNVLGSVNALSEGINVHADMAILVAGLSKERHTIQRLGRLLRKTADGKLGKAFLLVARGTQDEKWAENAVANLGNTYHYKAEDLGL